ncbi:MAG: class I SAM-dependent methyltransferase [Kiritimatiellia bacterium]
MNSTLATGCGNLYRSIRSVTYMALEPIDWTSRRLNGLRHYPPLWLKRHSGALGSPDGSATEFAAYLKLLLGLKSTHRLWDIGCGSGLLELALETGRFRGQVVATDIHRPSIRWAQKTISRRMPQFEFLHADIRNDAYWPKGHLTAEEWFAEFDGNDFDVVIAKSLFTHMLPDEMNLYLREIAHRLKDGGTALLSFFLLNPTQKKLEHRNDILFRKPDNETRYAVKYTAVPTAAVAYDERHISQCLKNAGLRLRGDIHYGFWTGRDNGLSYQDIVLVDTFQRP